MAKIYNSFSHLGPIFLAHSVLSLKASRNSTYIHVSLSTLLLYSNTYSNLEVISQFLRQLMLPHLNIYNLKYQHIWLYQNDKPSKHSNKDMKIEQARNFRICTLNKLWQINFCHSRDFVINFKYYFYDYRK